jgi:hypothetical protein
MFRKFLANRFTDSKFKKISQAQNEALLDVVALSMAADGLLQSEERAEVDAAIKLLSWADHSSPKLYFDGACDRAAGLLGDPEQLGAFLDEVNTKLETEWLREEAYYIAARVAAADADVAVEERELLSQLVVRFGIPKDRLRTITEKLMSEFTI